MHSALTILTAVLAIVGAGIIIARPYWAFLAITLMFPCEQLLQAYFPILQVHTTVVNTAIGALALAAVGLRAIKREPIFDGLSNSVTHLTYLQFGLFLAAMLYSPGYAAYEVQLAQTGPYLILNLLILPLLVVRLEEFHRILVGMMLVGSILAVLIILNPNTHYWAGRLTIDLGMMSRSDDTVGNPLATATLGGTTALIAIFMVPRQRNGLITVLRVAAFVLGLGLAIGSGSRGQVLATVVAAVMFFPVARRLNNPRNFVLSVVALGVVAAGIYITFQLFIGDQNRERWDTFQMVRDIAMRFDMCAFFLTKWLSSPAHWLFGLGTHSWMVVGADQFNADYVHNTPVEILCEQGLVGGAIFVTLTYLVIRSGLVMWRIHRDDPALRAASATILAICAFELFNSLKQGTISNGTPFYWWLVLAKLSSCEQRQSMLAASDHFPNEAQAENDAGQYGAVGA